MAQEEGLAFECIYHLVSSRRELYEYPNDMHLIILVDLTPSKELT